MKMNVADDKQLDETAAMAIIQKYWAPKVVDSIKNIKSMRDGRGVLFDLRID